jgi:hypothetical protein
VWGVIKDIRKNIDDIDIKQLKRLVTVQNSDIKEVK